MNKRTDKEIADFLGISNTALDQLRSYIDWAEQAGTYWRPREQFDKRHKSIKTALNMWVEWEL